MKRFITRTLAWLVAGLGMAATVHGQALPSLEQTPANTFSLQPSTDWPPPPPSIDQDPRIPTAGQWQNGTAFSGWLTTRIMDGATVVAGSPDLTAGPTTLIAPSDANGVTLSSVRMGRPLLARQPTVFFGEVIARPSVDNLGQPVAPTDYLPEPANLATGKFYYSPHARTVFATQGGIVDVTWTFRNPAHVPATMTLQYVVSASPPPGRPAKRVFWTEKGFKGPVVQVPQGPISRMNVIYSAQFPAQVAAEYESPYAVPGDPAAAQPDETRTFWFSEVDRTLRAYNAEGRVFVEILGPQEEGGATHRHLGTEVVEIIREVPPALVRTFVGDKVLPPDGDAALEAEVINGLSAAPPFLHPHVMPSRNRIEHYAVATTNQPTGAPDQPSGEVLIYWKQAGDYAILWPKYYSTYIVTWPEYGDAYTLYARQAATDATPLSTAVSFDPDNSSTLVFQDDTSGQQANVEGALKFFTTVSATDPDARALVQHTNGEAIWFERVHSKLDTTFDGYTGAPGAADTGARIEPPAGFEPGLGYIHQTAGTAFDHTAYKNPFVEGVANARNGAIIGVNARPGHNVLEVWWYKASTPPAGSGIKPTYYPGAVQRYTLSWPASPAEIVLASNAGSGELSSRQAAGRIYYQNDPEQPGFNPNDEHALMAAGRAWALRDDLGTEQTSEPYVLVRYTETDSRPAMTVFKVLREKPADDLVFEYEATAGTILQAPMPLPILPLPFLPDGTVANNMARVVHDPAPNTGAPLNYNKYAFKDRKGSTWIYRGPHDENEEAFFAMQYYYVSMEGFYLPGVTGQPAPGTIMPYLREENPDGGGYDGAASGAKAQALAIGFIPVWPEFAPQLRIGETLTLPKFGLPAVRGQTSMQVIYEQSLALEADLHSAVLFDPTRAKSYALGDDLEAIPGSVVTSSYRGKLWFPNLPPHLSQRFYFDPNLGQSGSLVFIGEFKDEAFGEDYLLLNVLSEADTTTLKNLCHSSDAKKDDWEDAIDGLETIVETFTEDPVRRGTYVPIMPKTTNTVDTAARNAAWNWLLEFTWQSDGIYFSDLQNKFRDQNAQELTPLWKWMDTNRDKLRKLRSDYEDFAHHKRWEGDLSERGFTSWLTDENRWAEATNPASVARARDDINNHSFHFLSPIALRDATLAQFDKWVAQIQKDRTDLYNDLTKAVYTETTPDYVTGSIDELTEVTDPDTAVDSYALSAAGGGEGWVVLVSGNGKAFTPEGEPVSLHVIRVTAPLGRGELKVLQPANPLDEKLTLQQSLDYGAAEQDYEFQWRYAPPVDGLPPVLYTFNRSLLLGDGGWTLTSGSGAETPATLPGSVEAHDGAALSRTFTVTQVPLRAFVSLDAGPYDGLRVLINGAPVASWRYPGVPDTAVSAKPLPDFSPLSRLMEIPASALQSGQNTIELLLHTTADAGSLSFVNARVEGMLDTEQLASWIEVNAVPGEVAGEVPGSIKGKHRHIIQGPGIFTLTDNYFICRYRATDDENAAWEEDGGWSKWTQPQLAEGWIKRALAGINPFEQRVKDLYNNDVNTDVSLLTQAGKRWEGDIALNLENIDSFGLIEIYETILRRGKSLSIEGTPPLSYGPANDALLLASGYLNDLYMLVGNEAYADAANPTIAFNTDSGQFGDVATSLFAFKGQLSSVLDEELGLLRGRDDFLPPGVRTAPVYNRLVWNFTRGIDSGEAVYALNYNIKDLNADGGANALDASLSFPQGHGDAYGHYLTAMTNYYSLLRNSHFDWTPRSEAVLLLGQPVAVDYLDERKFAAAAAALGRTTAQILDLTYRKSYNPASATNPTWTHLKDGRLNSQTGITRSWGVDDWATRGGQGSFLHWVTANSTLPDVDPDPNHEGIQKIDRTTVPELVELVTQSEGIQRSLDTADARLNPLGLAGGALPFDISPTQVDAGKTHYEQIYDRAIDSLKNAVAAFNNAKSTTQLLRSQDESLAKQRDAIQAQERAFQAQLTDLYGTPYAEDIGPGKTYAQGYVGPDYFHFMYVDMPELFKNTSEDDAEDQEFTLRSDTDFTRMDLNDRRWFDPDIYNKNKDSNNNGVPDWLEDLPGDVNHDLEPLPDGGMGEALVYKLASNGMFRKPENFARRARPGRIQDAISEMMMARLHLHNALEDYQEFGLQARRLIRNYRAAVVAYDDERARQVRFGVLAGSFEIADFALEKVDGALEIANEVYRSPLEILKEALPRVLGLANDPFAGARAAFEAKQKTANLFTNRVKTAIEIARKGFELAGTNLERLTEIENLDIAWSRENAQLVTDLKAGWEDLEDGTRAVDQALRSYDDAERKLRMLTHEASRIMDEREVFRKKASAIIQGFRTKDFGFRAFRNEALESYKALFDLAARYTFLAARAYDYETGLADASGSSAANTFFQQIVQARALGVITADGRPQNAGSQGGDPGLTGALARMNADWSVVRTRLGFNNPDRYRTTFSLRREKERILPAVGGDVAWGDVLAAAKMNNMLEDDDVRRYCMQINSGDALSVPGYVIPFQTTISEGFNFFGQPLAGGDSTYSPTSFATKIRNVGIAFNGYVGMASPTSIGGGVAGAGGASPPDPNLGFLDPNALSATPYVYLIAAGEDSMRSPAIGDLSTVRTWQVEDQAIPLPFDIGGADIGNNIFTPGQSLSETFTIRKHQAFRAVPDGTVFSSAPGFTNSRLIGRSVWNSRWKLVIPARTLLADPVKGMQIFQATVKDIKIHFETYSYSGN